MGVCIMENQGEKVRIRPTQYQFALQYPAELYISYDDDVKKFIVKRCSLNHCLPNGQGILLCYLFKWRFDSDYLKELQDIVALGPKLKLVRQYIKQFGKKVILKDLSTKAKLQAKDDWLFLFLCRNWATSFHIVSFFPGCICPLPSYTVWFCFQKVLNEQDLQFLIEPRMLALCILQYLIFLDVMIILFFKLL